MNKQHKLQGWTTPSDRVSRACADMIAEELNERGILVEIDKIVITKEPTRDRETFLLIKSGALEHPDTRITDQLICIWVVNGYYVAKSEETVDDLIVGEYRTLPRFVRLGHRAGNKWHPTEQN